MSLIWRLLIAAISVAIYGGLTAIVLDLFARRKNQRLTEPTTYPRIQWDGFVVCVAFVMFVLTPHLMQGFLAGTGFYHLIYGPEFPVAAVEDPVLSQQAANTIRYLWASAVAFPLQVMVISQVARLRGGPNPLDPRRFAPNFVNGFLTWLLITPIAFSVFALANIAHATLTNRPPDQHPLTVLGKNAGNLEWILFVLQTVIIAPILEELVFRGILLPWLCQKKARSSDSPFLVLPEHRSPMFLGLAILAAMVFSGESLKKAIVDGDRLAILAHSMPGVFFLSLIPVYLLLPRLSRIHRRLRIRTPRHTRAILASSALFAAFHTTVWPSPVPLMVLASGLGYLTVRTRSLVGPVVVHSLFNAVSAATLLLGGQGNP